MRRTTDGGVDHHQKLHQRVVAEAIELEIDLETDPDLFQLLGEALFLGDPNAVGVDHDVADRTRPRRGDDLPELRMDGRLAAGELDQVRLALGRDHRVEHRLDLGQALVPALSHRAVGEADRAGEVAGIVDLDDAQAAMLLVVGTEAAIPRAAALGLRRIVQRPVAGLQPAADVEPVIRVLLDQRLGDAMIEAALLKEDLALLTDDLGRNELPAGLAQARRLAVEDPRHALACEVSVGGERVHRRSGHKRSFRPREDGTGRTGRSPADRA